LSAVVLQRYMTAAAHPLVGGDHHPAVGVEDAVLQGLRGEAAEHHRMHRADAGAGQHGHRRLRDHRHVDADPVALLDAAGLEHVAELADLCVELAIGDLLIDVGIVALPDQGHLVAAGVQVAVQAVVGHVELAAGEPFDVQVLRVEAPVGDLVPFLEPAYIVLCLLGPEAVGVLHRALVHLVVLRGGDIGRGGELGRYRIDLFGLLGKRDTIALGFAGHTNGRWGQRAPHAGHFAMVFRDDSLKCYDGKRRYLSFVSIGNTLVSSWRIGGALAGIWGRVITC
jgi:hypothetical protein